MLSLLASLDHAAYRKRSLLAKSSTDNHPPPTTNILALCDIDRRDSTEAGTFDTCFLEAVVSRQIIGQNAGRGPDTLLEYQELGCKASLLRAPHP